MIRLSQIDQLHRAQSAASRFVAASEEFFRLLSHLSVSSGAGDWLIISRLAAEKVRARAAELERELAELKMVRRAGGRAGEPVADQAADQAADRERGF